MSTQTNLRTVTIEVHIPSVYVTVQVEHREDGNYLDSLDIPSFVNSIIPPNGDVFVELADVTISSVLDS